MITRTQWLPGLAGLVLIAAVAPACATAQRPPAPAAEPLPAVVMFSTQAVAGKTVGVLPLTMIVADSALTSSSAYAAYRDRRQALSRADSLIGEALLSRGPEVGWVLPPSYARWPGAPQALSPIPTRWVKPSFAGPSLRTFPIHFARP